MFFGFKYLEWIFPKISIHIEHLASHCFIIHAIYNTDFTIRQILNAFRNKIFLILIFYVHMFRIVPFPIQVMQSRIVKVKQFSEETRKQSKIQLFNLASGSIDFRKNFGNFFFSIFQSKTIFVRKFIERSIIQTHKLDG